MLIRYKTGSGWQRQSRHGWQALPQWAAVYLLGTATVAQYETAALTAPPTQEAA